MTKLESCYVSRIVLMYERGPYAKGKKRREEILETTLQVFSQLGYRGATLRAIARELDISPALLQHYFGTRDELLTQIITAWDDHNERLHKGLPLIEGFLQGIGSNVEIPGLIHLYTAFSVEASDPDHPSRDFFRQRYLGITERMAGDIERMKSAGVIPADVDAARTARALIAACEGLQMRWLNEADFDMREEFEFILGRFGITPEGMATLRAELPGVKSPR